MGTILDWFFWFFECLYFFSTRFKHYDPNHSREASKSWDWISVCRKCWFEGYRLKPQAGTNFSEGTNNVLHFSRKVTSKNLPLVSSFVKSNFCWQSAGIRIPYHLGSICAKLLALNLVPYIRSDNVINSKITLWWCDITNLNIDCIVNAASENLECGFRIDVAIYKARLDLDLLS